MTTRHILIAIAIADILVFGGLISREVMARGRGTHVKLPVRGYDPRDLIAGHYIRFRLLAVDEANDISLGHDSYCLEDTGGDGRYHVTSVRYGDDDCDTYLRRVDPTFGVDRFYIDERKAKDLAWIPGDAEAYITAVVSHDGRIHVTNLVIDDKPVNGE